MNIMIKTILAFGLCLFIYRPLTATEPASISSDTIKARAVALLDQGKHQEAYDLLAAGHAGDKEDIDTAFMLGQSAMLIKRPAEAVKLYEEILAKDPQLPRVRLELGRAYAAVGEVQKAKDQFRAVLADSPPPAVGENIGKFMNSMQSQKNWNAKVNVGFIYDSNINAGPTASTVLMFGVPFHLANDARETSGHGYTASVEAGYLRKLAGDLSLQSDAQYSAARYPALHGFDSGVLSGSTGLTLQKKAFILSAPVILEYVKIGNTRYDYAIGISPQIMVPLTDRLVANASWVGQNKHYFVNDGLRNGSVWSTTAGAKYYYRQNAFFQLSGRHAGEKTKVNYTNNRSNSINLSWYTGQPKGFSLYLSPGISATKYAEAEAAFDERRMDTQYTAVLNLSKDLSAPGWSGTFGYTFTRNNSNLRLYDYTRSQVTAQLSRAF